MMAQYTADVLGALSETTPQTAAQVCATLGGDPEETRSALRWLVKSGHAVVAARQRSRLFRRVASAPVVAERTGTNPFEWRTYRQWSPS